jgi:hypothetical protein
MQLVTEYAQVMCFCVGVGAFVGGGDVDYAVA